MATVHNGCISILRLIIMLRLTQAYLFYVAADETVSESSQILPQFTNKSCTENTTYVYVTQETYPATCYKNQQTCNFWGCKNKVVPYTCYRQRYINVVASAILPACCPGYIPTEHNYTCVRGCETGFFGINCTEKCLCPDNAFLACGVDIGNCTCKPGWTGENCTEACSSEYYGQDCKNQCTCKNNATCDPVNGTCTCNDGWKGLTCDEECPEGFYGANCSYNCTCPINKTCDRFNGQCLCPAGLKGDNCSIGCSNNTYGRDCMETCGCERENTLSCDPVDGTCVCKAGWSEKSCQERCPLTFFGLNCTELCTCTDAQDCNPQNGNCTCKTGYIEPNCTAEQGRVGTLETDTQTVLIAVIAGSVAVMVIIFCVAFLILVRLRLRRKTGEKELNNGTTHSTGDDMYVNSTFDNYVNVDTPEVQPVVQVTCPFHVKAPNNDEYAVVEKQNGRKTGTTTETENKHTRSPKSTKNDVYASMKTQNGTVKPECSKKGDKSGNGNTMEDRDKSCVVNHDNTINKDDEYDLLSNNKKGNVVKEEMAGDNYDHLHALTVPTVGDSSQYDTMKAPVDTETRDDLYDRVTDIKLSGHL